jgi:hypothetical protein
VSYIVDGIGEFHSLGAALQAAVVTNDSGLPQLKILPPPNAPKALPAPPQLTRPAGPPVVAAPAPASDPLETVLWVGLAALAAYAVYTLVKDDKPASKAEDDEGSEADED